MDFIASINALIFIFLSGIHFYWMLGGKWGMNSVIPTKEKTNDKLFKPSHFSTVVVATGLLMFALVELGNTGVFSDFAESKYFHTGTLLTGFIFLIRAVGDFNYVGFFKKIKTTVFAKNDTRYYSPLCLFIAVTSILLGLA